MEYISHKIFLILFFCFSLILPLFGQTSEAKAPQAGNSRIDVGFPNLKKQADEMAKAISSNDFAKFVGYIHPKVIKIAGGKEKFIKDMKDTIEKFKSSGIELTSYDVLNPIQIIDFDKEKLSVLPTETVLKTPNGKVMMRGALLGISADGGSNWNFIRIDSKESIKRLLPEIADKLTIPEIGIR